MDFRTVMIYARETWTQSHSVMTRLRIFEKEILRIYGRIQKMRNGELDTIKYYISFR